MSDSGSGPFLPAGIDPQERPGVWDRVWVWFGGHPPRTPRERARARVIRRGLVAGGLLLLIGSMIQLPLLILSPGPTYNTIGEVDGQPMIEITGTRTYPTQGALDMTTVSERGGSSGGVHLGEALLGWVSPAGTVVPRESIYGPEVDGEEVSQRNDQLFATSQSDAIAAAMAELGIETEESVVVTQVSGGSPADGIVKAGDTIVAVDGRAVDNPAEVGEIVRAGEVGATVTLDVLRTEDPAVEPEAVTLEVVTGANPDLAAEDPQAPPVPYLGILVGEVHEPPFPIVFSLDNVGGPSAGMMFSLAIVDMLTPEPLTGGGHVAGTGSIDPDGVVGPIGGIAQKLRGAQRAGATLFLAPRDNCDEVVGNEPAGLTVVPVGTLTEARDLVERWVADPEAQLPSCSAVAAAPAG
jgi:PDZ domain-containing protein